MQRVEKSASNSLTHEGWASKKDPVRSVQGSSGRLMMSGSLPGAHSIGCCAKGSMM